MTKLLSDISRLSRFSYFVGDFELAAFADQQVRVKGYRRKGKLVRAFVRRQKKAQPKQSPGNSNALKAAITGASIAATVGVPAVAFFAMQRKYKAGFAQSAKMAEELAQSISVGKVKAKQQHIVFSVGGSAYKEAVDTNSGEYLMMTAKKNFSRAGGSDFKSVPVSNASYNLLSGRSAPSKNFAINYARDVFDLYATTLRRGRNMAAVDLAANVIAYGDKFPDRQLVMMGHSSGGFVVHEAQEILRRARPGYENRLKSVAIGSEWFGATEKFGKSVTLGNPNDFFTSVLPTRDLRVFKNAGKGEPSHVAHRLKSYAQDDEVKRFVQRFIYDDVG